MSEPALVTAERAAELTGYGTVRRFRGAVLRGVMPQPLDSRARPQMWSWPEIKTRLKDTPKESEDLTLVNRLDELLNLKAS